MAKTMKEMITDARTRVQTVSNKVALAAVEVSADIILDVREPAELVTDGKVEGSVHVPRGTLEAKACAESVARSEEMLKVKERGKVHVLCASGGRAALAADTLREMGYDATVIEGGFKKWKDDNLPTA